MTYWAWECNASGVITVNGGYGCFWLKNNTTGGVWATQIVPKLIDPPNQFVGQTAEGIAERPGGWEHPNSLPVSQFPYFIGMQFSALDSVGNWHAMGLDPYTILRIHNQSGATLAFGTNPFAEHDIVRFIWAQAQ
jgi:hypothetical protein